MNLHGQIMNLQVDPKRVPIISRVASIYLDGHRDARHAAAELALAGDAAIATLVHLDMRLRECMALGLTAAEAYDSFYQESTKDALAAAGLK